MRFKIDWASLIVGSKFTVFALFYFVFEDNFPGTSPCGGLHLEGRFNGGFFCVTGLRAYHDLKGLISEFYGVQRLSPRFRTMYFFYMRCSEECL